MKTIKDINIPEAPPCPPDKKIIHDIMIKIFSKWIEEYQKNPDDFAEEIEKDGNIPDNYAEDSADYFLFLAKSFNLKVSLND